MFPYNVFCSQIILNSESLDIETININGTTMIPLRGFFEKLGYTVEYYPNEKTAILRNSDNIITIIDGNNYFTINSKIIYPTVAQKIINSKLYIPLRDIAESIRLEVNWNKVSDIINIRTLKDYEKSKNEIIQLVNQYYLNEGKDKQISSDGISTEEGYEFPVYVPHIGATLQSSGLVLYGILEVNKYTLVAKETSDFGEDIIFNLDNKTVSENKNLDTKTFNYKANDFLGLTIKDITNKLGTDIKFTNYMISGGLQGIYYEDLRVPFNFCYLLENGVGSKFTGNEIINYIEIKNNGYILDNLTSSMRIKDIENLGFKGETYNNLAQETFEYNVKLDNKIISFVWNNKDMEKPSDMAYIYIYHK